MYNTGTVTATANSTKLIGTGTKWLNNINRVSVEQAIQIQIGATVHNNSIQSIQSDTELTLNFPLPTAAAAAKYVILTTMVHSVSDAMNKIVSMNGANVQFSDILTRWMTEQGIITVTLPDQTTQQLRTTKEMDKQLDGKLDAALAEKVASSNVTWKGTHQFPMWMDVIRGDYRFSMSQMDDTGRGESQLVTTNTKTKEVYQSILPKKNGTLMHVGDFGVGKSINIPDGIKLASLINVGTYTQQMSGNAKLANGYPFAYAGTLIVRESGGSRLLQEYRAFHLPGLIACRSIAKDGIETAWEILYSTGNTTKDANGNLKAASPIIKVFADHIKLNDESEGVELEKLSTGRYKLKGTLGMNSDASWGGYHGGLVIPNGINNLPLVWADFKVEADGDIIIETHYRKHADLPPPVVLNRLITYPEFMDENGNELDSYTPCDIPNGHWIDVRVNMPSDSLYNQKQAEAQRLAEIEAERLAKEEAERIAEEAEQVRD